MAVIYKREGYVSTDLPDHMRGGDMEECAIATFLDPAGEVFLKGFESQRFGDCERKVSDYADRHGLTVVSIVVGEASADGNTSAFLIRR